jgi:hypothetical protein
MIGMLMGDEDAPDFLHGQSEPVHPVFRFPAGDAGIDQHCLVLIAYIIAIAIAS